MPADTPRQPPLTLRIPPVLHATLRRLTDECRRPINQIVIELLHRGLRGFTPRCPTCNAPQPPDDDR